eukprot:222807-Amphidinium_carterae.1
MPRLQVHKRFSAICLVQHWDKHHYLQLLQLKRAPSGCQSFSARMRVVQALIAFIAVHNVASFGISRAYNATHSQPSNSSIP